MIKKAIQKFFKDTSLNLTFFSVIFLSSFLPFMLSLYLLYANYNHERIAANNLNSELQEETKVKTQLLLRSIQSDLKISSQNQTIFDLLSAQKNVRSFIENRAYGFLTEFRQNSQLNFEWALISPDLKEVILKSDRFEIDFASLFSNKNIVANEDLVIVSEEIKFDDQNLPGPNAVTKGFLQVQIPIRNIQSIIPTLKTITKIDDIASIEIVVSEIKRSTLGTIVTFGLILVSLVGSIFLGLILIQEKIIGPIRSIYQKLHITSNFNAKNEISLLEKTIESYIENIKNQEFEKSEKEKLVAANMIASQVAHDIRSPLTALNMVIGTMDRLPEDKRILVRNAIQRINDIANDLLSKGKMAPGPRTPDNIDVSSSNSETASTVMLSSLIDILVSEKRTQFRDKIGIQIGADLSQSYGLFSKLPANELKRVLSNLVNNSVEAFDTEYGRIFIHIKEENDWIKIDVVDNGKGIPPHILHKLGSQAISFGKEGTSSGSGLGIQHAFKFMNLIGGKIEFISSIEGSTGTTVSMLIPKSQPPVWFVSKIEIPENGRVVALDDDQSIHSVWQGRLLSLKANENKIQLTGFTSAEIFKKWFTSQSHPTENTVFLIDYELLGQKVIGLDLIEELNLQRYSILVSSRYDEKNVYERCKRLGVRIIPKAMAGLVPIEISKQRTLFDAVLIDDDPLVHMTWNVSAKENSKNIISFKTDSDFFANVQSIDTNSPVVIDLQLKNGVSGDVVAQKVYELGFKNIFIGTGVNSVNLSQIPWIKGALGKAPDWNMLSLYKT